MKVYIAGKITGLEKAEYMENFAKAEKLLKEQGHIVLNPTILSHIDLTQREYLHICFSMIDVADTVYMLSNWLASDGAKKEYQYAKDNLKTIIFENEVSK